MTLIKLFRKDLRLELQRKELGATMLLFSGFILIFFSLTLRMNGSRESIELLFPGLIWTSTILGISLGGFRIFEYELESDSLSRLLMLRIELWKLYGAKVLFLTILGFFCHLILTALASLFLSVSLLGHPSFLLLSLLGVLGASALSILVGAITLRNRLGIVLLPLLLLPLLLPFFFALLSSTTNIMNANTDSFWWLLLGSLTLFYTILGVNLFPLLFSPETPHQSSK